MTTTEQTVTIAVPTSVARLAAEELFQAVRQIRDDEGAPSTRALRLEELAVELLRVTR